MTTALLALSPLDGRYQQKTLSLASICSEFGLIKQRVRVEIAWLIYLASLETDEIKTLRDEQINALQSIVDEFTVVDAETIKQLEAQTNHDVKAVEYFIKAKLKQNADLTDYQEFVHFGCTSEDINNLAYALMLQETKPLLVAHLTQITETLAGYATLWADLPMLARTHGQAATPTTVGKEFANMAYRLQLSLPQFINAPIRGKWNGAVGNFNAHCVAYPELDWLAISKHFVESLGLVWNPMTTQIEPHDYLAEHLTALARINSILVDLCRDCWGYIALQYFQQQPKAEEVGSSTMPHKVNPIDFENAEGNLLLTNSIALFLAQQLPTSRWQRDLVDSTLLRNIGVVFGYASVAYQSICKGLNKLKVNEAVIQADLDTNWEVLAEAIQTVMRRYGLPEPYEQLKALTRGKRLSQTSIRAFIESLALPEGAKATLLALTPANYLGLAASLARNQGSQ
jgi:adenylosuccinate lyase